MRRVSNKRRALGLLVFMAVLLAGSSIMVFAAEEAAEYVPSMYASFWSLVPAVVAIILALITKEVYSSLFAGIVMGGLFCCYVTFSLVVKQILKRLKMCKEVKMNKDQTKQNCLPSLKKIRREIIKAKLTEMCHVVGRVLGKEL